MPSVKKHRAEINHTKIIKRKSYPGFKTWTRSAIKLLPSTRTGRGANSHQSAVFYTASKFGYLANTRAISLRPWSAAICSRAFAQSRIHLRGSTPIDFVPHDQTTKLFRRRNALCIQTRFSYVTVVSFSVTLSVATRHYDASSAARVRMFYFKVSPRRSKPSQYVSFPRLFPFGKNCLYKARLNARQQTMNRLQRAVSEKKNTKNTSRPETGVTGNVK